MTNPYESPLEIHKRFASLEKRVAKLESNVADMDKILDPEGWIGEAFEVMESHMDRRLDAVDQRLDSVDTKLNIIMQHLTGLKDSES